MRITLLAFFLCGILVFQIISFMAAQNRSTFDISTDKISIDTIPSQSEFLESDLIKEGFNPNRVQKFRVVNNSPKKVLVFAESPSCGCISFTANGQPLEINQGRLLESGNSLIVGLKIRMPSSSTSVYRSFDLVVRTPLKKKVLMKKKLMSRLVVHKNFEINTPAVEFLVNSDKQSGNKLTATIHITTTTYDPEKSLTINPSGFLKDELTIINKLDGPIEKFSSHFYRHKYKVLLTLNNLSKLIDRQNSFNDLYVKAFLPTDTATAPFMQIPVRLKDISQLKVKRSIRFGTTNRGTTKSVSILVSTPDDAPFTFLCEDLKGPGKLEFKVNSNQSLPKFILTIIFTGDKPGDYHGNFMIVPKGKKYRPTKINYTGKVI